MVGRSCAIPYMPTAKSMRKGTKYFGGLWGARDVAEDERMRCMGSADPRYRKSAADRPGCANLRKHKLSRYYASGQSYGKQLAICHYHLPTFALDLFIERCAQTPGFSRVKS